MKRATAAHHLAMLLDTRGWSGDGEFTQMLLDVLKAMPQVAFLRVEDAPATRAEVGYNFISNEFYVGFEVRQQTKSVGGFRFLTGRQSVPMREMTLDGLVTTLTTLVGPPDYSDENMLQYLRTKRIVQPYQTKGCKHVELVRIYEAVAWSRR